MSMVTIMVTSETSMGNKSEALLFRQPMTIEEIEMINNLANGLVEKREENA